MTLAKPSGRLRPLILAAHLLALLGGLAFTWANWEDVARQKAAVAEAQSMVDQLDARLSAARAAPGASAPPAHVDPFLPGASITIAGAALQGRVVSAVRAAGGTVTSSQIDTTGATAAPPVVVLTVSCTLPPTALQPLLYRLENDAPALFFDAITVESAAVGASPDGIETDAPLKIAMTVSAYWSGEKS